jgi:hypothetical protein
MESDFIYLFIYFGGVRTQYFVLANQALYYLSHHTSPFRSGYFGDDVKTF